MFARPSAAAAFEALLASFTPCEDAVPGSELITLHEAHVVQVACGPTQVGISPQPCAKIWLTQELVRLDCEQPLLTPPM